VSPVKKDSEDGEKPMNGGSSSGSPPLKKQKTKAEPAKIEETKTAKPIDQNEARKIIKKMFLVDMPDELYSFWELCLKINPKNPLGLFTKLFVSSEI
jgi:hypothetical protein